MALPMREAMLAGLTARNYRVLFEVVTRKWWVRTDDGTESYHADSETGQKRTNDLGARA